MIGADDMRSPLVIETRWSGAHGIGRFSREILGRMPAVPHTVLPARGRPSHPLDILQVECLLRSLRLRGGLFFSPGYAAPATRYCRALLTIHDLMAIQVGEESSIPKSIYFRQFVRPALRDAGRFLTVSRYSASQICEWAGLPEQAAIVVGNGVSSAFDPAGDRLQLERPYFLYVGNFKPHKNVPTLLNAFAQFVRRNEALDLVIARAPDTPTLSLCERLRIRDRIKFLPGLTDESLACAYRGAVATLIPSIDEGFGLPAIEAMACGTPVIASTGGALPEVCSDAALCIDPLSCEAIVGAMEKLSSDTQLRTQLAGRGISNASRYRWDAVAQRTWDAVLNMA